MRSSIVIANRNTLLYFILNSFFQFVVVLYFGKSALNPLVYGWKNQELREAIVRVARRRRASASLTVVSTVETMARGNSSKEDAKVKTARWEFLLFTVQPYAFTVPTNVIPF